MNTEIKYREISLNDLKSSNMPTTLHNNNDEHDIFLFTGGSNGVLLRFCGTGLIKTLKGDSEIEKYIEQFNKNGYFKVEGVFVVNY